MAELAAQWDRRLAAIKRLAETARDEQENKEEETVMTDKHLAIGLR